MFGRSSKYFDQDTLDVSAPYTKDITIDEVAKAHAKLKILDLRVINKPIAEVNDPRLIEYIKKVRADTLCANNLLKYYSYTIGKTVANVVAPLASTANSGVSAYLGVSVVAAVTVGVGTGGLALIGAGAAMTVGGIVQSGVSIHKTNNHIKNLNIIMNHFKMLNTQAFGKYQGIASKCNCHDENSHYYKRENVTQCQFIVSHVLPYIIEQKEKKRRHRAMHVSVIGSPLESVRGLGRFAWKKYKGTQGKGRNEMAMFLTRQHLTTYCMVTDKIISQLLSNEESLGMRSLSRQQGSVDTVTIVSEIIFRKLGCT